jgi:hypothetical protein
MFTGPCFPDLPGGDCWPRDGGGRHRGCFPSQELERLRRGRTSADKQLRRAGARAVRGHGTAGAVARFMDVMVELGRQVARG